MGAIAVRPESIGTFGTDGDSGLLASLHVHVAYSRIACLTDNSPFFSLFPVFLFSFWHILHVQASTAFYFMHEENPERNSESFANSVSD